MDCVGIDLHNTKCVGIDLHKKSISLHVVRLEGRGKRKEKRSRVDGCNEKRVQGSGFRILLRAVAHEF